MNRTSSKKGNKKKSIILLVFVVVVLLGVIIASLTLSNDSARIEKEQDVAEQHVTEQVEKTKESSETGKKNDSEQSNSKVKSKEPTNETEPIKENGNTNQQANEGKINNGYIENQPLPTDPTIIEGILIANKKYPLPKNFNPGENKEARAAFEKMATDARLAGFELVAFSTYRSYEYQQTLYEKYVARDGQENADRYSARPGYSEHQTGLAFDIGEKGREDLWLTSEFGESEAGKWLVENANKYGFILRYPQGKENVTGYMYESWHFRYLGIDLATKVKKSGVTLEEYLGI